MWYLISHLPSNPLVLLISSLIFVVGCMFGLARLVVRHWPQIIGSLVVAFSNSVERRAAGLDLAKIGQDDRQPPKALAPAAHPDDGGVSEDSG